MTKNLRAKALIASSSPDIIVRVEQALEGLSQSEKRIGELLLDSPVKFSQMNVRQVAAEASISEPTVVRFCRNVGCDGFKDLKIQLVQDIAFRQAVEDSSESSGTSPTINKTPAYDMKDPLDRCFAGAQITLSKVRETIDRKALGAAARLIARSQRTVIYGLGGSSAVLALELHNRLFRLGLFSVPFTDSYQQRMSAASLGKTDTAVFISSTGRPRSLLDSVDLARYYKAKCIGIAPQESALARDMDICLHVELSQTGVDPLQPNPMRFAQLLSIDALSFCVAQELGDGAKEHLKRSRASVASLHGIAPQQPIGD